MLHAVKHRTMRALEMRSGEAGAPVAAAPSASLTPRSLGGGCLVLEQDGLEPGDALQQLPLALLEALQLGLVGWREHAAVSEQHELQLGALMQACQASDFGLRCSGH